MKNIVLSAAAIFCSTFAFAQEEINVGDFNILKVYDKIPVELISSIVKLTVISNPCTSS